MSPKGANGYLFFGHNTLLDREVAVKYYYWGGDARYHAEPAHLAQMHSDNIVTILDASLISNDYAYFITPYYENGDLDNYRLATSLGTQDVLGLVKGMLAGLTHLHSLRYLHRDLKPANIFISDTHTALIGDFGSVRRLPEGNTTIPGSGHSLIFTPPESASNGEYSFAGDTYQAGVVLFQLLGGYLPENETDWLTPKELGAYSTIADVVDRQLYATSRIRARIAKGRIVSLTSLPAWIGRDLRRVVAIACRAHPAKRFQTASAFLGKLHELSSTSLNWKSEAGLPYLEGPVSYRVSRDVVGRFYAERKRASGWRRDSRLTGLTLEELIEAIEEQVHG